jgi:HlyD family secretion protein
LGQVIIVSFEVAKASKQSAYYNVQSASATVNEAKDNLDVQLFMRLLTELLNVELGERV